MDGVILMRHSRRKWFCFCGCIFFFTVALRPNASHGLLILEVSRSHTTTHHSQWDSSGRVISLSQRPLTDHTQHSQQTSMPPVGFELTISAGERLQTYALDRVATGTCSFVAVLHASLCGFLWFSLDSSRRMPGEQSTLLFLSDINEN